MYIIPYIRYQLFLRRYVITYQGPNMSNNNILVSESCYLCHEPFKIGDKVVAKCEHTVHKECWDDNQYHCPEYSDRCKNGSHYYNTKKLHDYKNAPFYLDWILMAIIAAISAWALQMILGEMLNRFDTLIHRQLPSVGLFLGLFMTFDFSILTNRLSNLVRQLHWILLRTLLAAIGCYLSFFLVGYIVHLLQISVYLYLIEWIPWTLTGFIIALCATWNTRVRLRKIQLWLGIMLGFVSMYVWQYIFLNTEFSFQVLLLFSFIIFATGLALSIAIAAPRSERYFLKVTGAVKEMDIALYKWFRNRNKAVVTLGRSIDCSLQISWDITSDIAPIQAEIRLDENRPYLKAIEDGVFVEGKPLELDRKIYLYHGSTFTIGTTTFTYLEKDH